MALIRVPKIVGKMNDLSLDKQEHFFSDTRYHANLASPLHDSHFFHKLLLKASSSKLSWSPYEFLSTLLPPPHFRVLLIIGKCNPFKNIALGSFPVNTKNNNRRLPSQFCTGTDMSSSSTSKRRY